MQKIEVLKAMKSRSEDELLNALEESELLKESENNFDSIKPKINFSKSRIEEIRKKYYKLRCKFSKSKINKIRRNLYEIENKNNLSALKIKEIEKNLHELEKNLSKKKKYYDYDDNDNEYKGIKDVKDVFDLSIDEDYYKPIITNSAFNSTYIQYERRGNKDKILTISAYLLDMIRPYLSDIINDHKTQGEWRIHSGNTIIKHKTQGEWKIQLTMAINCISSKKDIQKVII